MLIEGKAQAVGFRHHPPEDTPTMIRRPVLIALTALALTACVSQETTSTTVPSDSTSPTVASTTTTDGTTSPPSPPSTDQTTTTLAATPTDDLAKSSETFPGVGGTALLESVDVTETETLLQVTFAFEHGPPPSYQVQYVEPPILASPSGEALDIPGAAFLELRVVPGAGVDLSADDARETFVGEDRFDPDVTGITEIAETEDFEAQLVWVVGLEGRYPFAVRATGNGSTQLTLTIDPTNLATPTTSMCENDTYSIAYPSEWWANDGSVTEACRFFAPEPMPIEEQSEVVAPVSATVDQVAFADVAAPSESSTELDRAVTLIDGRQAVRLVNEQVDGLLPAGTEVTTYAVDLGGDRTMVLSAADTFDQYTRNVAVLDEMARTVALSDPGDIDLVARYGGGGTPFDVSARVADDVCLTVEPAGEEVCFDAASVSGNQVVAEVVDLGVGDGVLLGIAGPDARRVQIIDGLAYLPVPVEDVDVTGWALPTDADLTPNVLGSDGDTVAIELS